MMIVGPTSDNLPLSGPKNRASRAADSRSAINCTTIPAERWEGRSAIDCTLMPDAVAELVRDSLAPNSRRAYASDLARFEAWGGSLPASFDVIATYLADHAQTHAASTLVRWVTALGKAHRAAGLADPTKNELVRSVIRGIRRKRGSAPKQAKPLLREDLFLVLSAIGDGLKDLRDRALLLIGFAGGFRRSELVSLDFDDVEMVRQGMTLRIRRSKTDQTGQGRQIGIPLARSHHCPVRALEHWVASAGITSGPLFRPVNRHGRPNASRLSGEAVALIVKERISAAGISADGYSGHSLRAGFATSAALAGVASWNIRKQTGHASDAMLQRYIRESELFQNNASGVLL